jgi:hypothetical protein
MLPEMIALRVGIVAIGTADTQNLLHQVRVGQRGAAQGGPIRSLSAGDDVVDGGQGEHLMVEVAVLHRSSLCFSSASPC